MLIALYNPWEGDEYDALSELLAAIMGPVDELLAVLDI